MSRIGTKRSLALGGAIAGGVFVGNAVALPVLINVATGGQLPAVLEPYRGWSFPLVAAWTVVGFVLAATVAINPGRRKNDVATAELPLVRRASNLRPRNRLFTGRAEILDRVRRSLGRGGPVAVVARPWQHAETEAQALHGMPGVGKTELALEFAHRFHDGYDIIWWVDANDPARLTSQLSRLAERLGLPAKGVAERCSAVLAELRQRDSWLVIFDNVPHPEAVADYLPVSSRGHVILTSRFRAWDAHAAPIRVDEFTEDEAVEYLTKRLPGSGRADVAALAKEVGRLPLALAQAAAYAQQRGIGVDTYLTLYSRHQGELLAAEGADRYPQAVQATFQLAFEEIGKRSPAAKQLMQLYAWLAPDGVPDELLVHGAEVLPQPLAAAAGSDLEALDTIGLLHAYSLVDHVDGVARIHRVVQAAVRGTLSSADRRRWLSYAVQTLDRAMHADEALHPALIPHAIQVAEHQELVNG